MLYVKKMKCARPGEYFFAHPVRRKHNYIIYFQPHPKIFFKWKGFDDLPPFLLFTIMSR